MMFYISTPNIPYLVFIPRYQVPGGTRIKYRYGTGIIPGTGYRYYYITWLNNYYIIKALLLTVLDISILLLPEMQQNILIHFFFLNSLAYTLAIII